MGAPSPGKSRRRGHRHKEFWATLGAPSIFRGRSFLLTGKSFLLTVGLLTVNWLGLFYLRLKFGLVLFAYGGKSVWSFFTYGSPCPEIRFGLFLLTVPPCPEIGFGLFLLTVPRRK